MPTYNALLLSGSPANGRVIPVAATASPGTLLHTAPSGDIDMDEVYLWASNVTAAIATLTVQWGGTANPGDDLVKQYVIPANSPPLPVAVGQRINGGLVIRAFSSVTLAINISGNVNAIRGI